jgi:hypothetical protein
LTEVQEICLPYTQQEGTEILLIIGNILPGDMAK